MIDKYVDEELSIGDFVLSGGEYAALCLIDAISRHIPGTLGNKDSYMKDTFSNGLLKGSVYTKPEIFEEMSVPKVLLSGNHKKIEEWRANNSLKQTSTITEDASAPKEITPPDPRKGDTVGRVNTDNTDQTKLRDFLKNLDENE